MSCVIEITMMNDLMRDSGTSKRDLVRALKAIGLQTHILGGGSKDDHGWCFPLAPDSVQTDTIGFSVRFFKAKGDSRFAFE